MADSRAAYETARRADLAEFAEVGRVVVEALAAQRWDAPLPVREALIMAVRAGMSRDHLSSVVGLLHSAWLAHPPRSSDAS